MKSKASRYESARRRFWRAFAARQSLLAPAKSLIRRARKCPTGAPASYAGHCEGIPSTEMEAQHVALLGWGAISGRAA